MNRYSLTILIISLNACSMLPDLGSGNNGEANPRIVYRDLTVLPPPPGATEDGEERYGRASLAELQALSRGSASPSNRSSIVNADEVDTVVIEFQNESDKLPRSGVPALKQLLQRNDRNVRYVIVGHSHGKSQIGTATLAHRRAEAVTGWLVNKGVSHKAIKQLGSWSRHASEGAPDKGVQIFVTRSDLAQRMAVQRLSEPEEAEVSVSDSSIPEDKGAVEDSELEESSGPSLDAGDHQALSGEGGEQSLEEVSESSDPTLFVASSTVQNDALPSLSRKGSSLKLYTQIEGKYYLDDGTEVKHWQCGTGARIQTKPCSDSYGFGSVIERLR